MIRAILDTNVLVQSLIGTARSSSVQALDAYYDGRFLLVYSPDALDELLDVLLLPQIRARHGLSDFEILEFIASLLVTAERFPGTERVGADIPRDLTDAKFLSLAAESGADYLVTNDRRHLLRVESFRHTSIVSPATFLRALR